MKSTRSLKATTKKEEESSISFQQGEFVNVKSTRYLGSQKIPSTCSSFKKQKKPKKRSIMVGGCIRPLPASPLRAFSTATPLSSSCLCFSSTCSSCLWMIWKSKRRRLPRVPAPLYDPHDPLWLKHARPHVPTERPVFEGASRFYFEIPPPLRFERRAN